MKLLTGVQIFFSIMKILCVIPFSLNFKTMKVKSSKKSIIYSVVLPVTLIVIDPYLEKIFRMKWYKLFNVESFWSLTILVYGTYTVISICIFWSILKTDLIFQIIYSIKASFEKLKIFNITFNYNDDLKHFLLKFSITQSSAVILHYMFYTIFFDSFTALLWDVPLVALKYMLTSAFLIKFDVFLNLLKTQISHLNKIIEKICLFVDYDCELSNKIDDLAKIYFNFFEISKMFTKKFSILMILSLGYIFLIIETQFLQMFIHIANKESNTRYPVIICIFFWACTRFSELAMVLYDCSRIVEKVIFFCLLL